MQRMPSTSARRLAAVAAIALGALVAAGCATGAGQGASSDTSIGVSMVKMRDPDVVVMNQAMSDEAESLEIGLSTVDAQGDTATEMTGIEDLIARNASAIVMMPVDIEASQAAAQRVNDAGIPLFLLNSRFPDDADIEYESFIGVQDSVAGEIQGTYVNEELPDGGTIIFLAGTYGAPWTDHRKSGFESTVNDNVTIASEIAANGNRDEAKKVMEDLLQRFEPGDIDGIVAQNDEMAIGASSAIKEAGRLDEFSFIIGVDGTDAGYETIDSGGMTATVRQDSAAQGSTAVATAAAFLRDEDIEDEIIIPFELVTSENLADFWSK